MRLVETSRFAEDGHVHPTVPHEFICAGVFVHILRAKIGEKGRKAYQLHAHFAQKHVAAFFEVEESAPCSIDFKKPSPRSIDFKQYHHPILYTLSERAQEIYVKFQEIMFPMIDPLRSNAKRIALSVCTHRYCMIVTRATFFDVRCLTKKMVPVF